MDAIVLEDSRGRKMSDEEFERFCLGNPDLRIERNSNLEISIMSPNAPLSSAHEVEILRQLSNWNFENKRGVVFSPSAGFTLSDKSILSPDASWISNERWSYLPQEEKEKFSHVCPDFVIEVRSKSDSLKELKSKMELWLKNGAQLAWLIDPKRETCWIYRHGRDPQEIKGKTTLFAEWPVEGFQLDLQYVY
jgi:Uma2 family endonuclease